MRSSACVSKKKSEHSDVITSDEPGSLYRHADLSLMASVCAGDSGGSYDTENEETSPIHLHTGLIYVIAYCHTGQCIMNTCTVHIGH